MSHVYTAHEARARFSEILQEVRSGRRVIVSDHGQEVAEIRPVEEEESCLDRRLRQLEARGVLGPPADPRGKLSPVANRPGALKRFLESRD